MAEEHDVGAPLAALARRWRCEAADLRARYGDERLARLCEVHAGELERAMAAQEQAVLSLSEAAQASGFSEGHIRALIAAGDLRNVGRRYRPRVLRGELPRKPGWTPPSGDGPPVPAPTDAPMALVPIVAPTATPTAPCGAPPGRSTRARSALSPEELAARLPGTTAR